MSTILPQETTEAHQRAKQASSSGVHVCVCVFCETIEPVLRENTAIDQGRVTPFLSPPSLVFRKIAQKLFCRLKGTNHRSRGSIQVMIRRPKEENHGEEAQPTYGETYLHPFVEANPGDRKGVHLPPSSEQQQQQQLHQLDRVKRARTRMRTRGKPGPSFVCHSRVCVRCGSFLLSCFCFRVFFLSFDGEFSCRPKCLIYAAIIILRENAVASNTREGKGFLGKDMFTQANNDHLLLISTGAYRRARDGKEHVQTGKCPTKGCFDLMV